MDYILFILTFAAVSYLPGLNMNMALSLSISVGYKKTLFMILGGTLGLGFVGLCCCFGAAAIILKYPSVFIILKIIGGAYIVYLGFKMFKESSNLKELKNDKYISNLSLFMQGFMLCNINPKAWIFLATLLPPFLDRQNPINFRMFILIALIMTIEFISYNTYALGGALFKKLMSKHTDLIHKISAILMVVIGIWIITN